MAKAILEFDLSDADDTLAHKRCVLSQAMIFAISDFDEYLRHFIKYDTDYLETKTSLEIVTEAREKFRELMFDRGVIIDDLIN